MAGARATLAARDESEVHPTQGAGGAAEHNGALIASSSSLREVHGHAPIIARNTKSCSESGSDPFRFRTGTDVPADPLGKAGRWLAHALPVPQWPRHLLVLGDAREQVCKQECSHPSKLSSLRFFFFFAECVRFFFSVEQESASVTFEDSGIWVFFSFDKEARTPACASTYAHNHTYQRFMGDRVKGNPSSFCFLRTPKGVKIANIPF